MLCSLHSHNTLQTVLKPALFFYLADLPTCLSEILFTYKCRRIQHRMRRSMTGRATWTLTGRQWRYVEEERQSVAVTALVSGRRHRCRVPSVAGTPLNDSQTLGTGPSSRIGRYRPYGRSGGPGGALGVPGGQCDVAGRRQRRRGAARVRLVDAGARPQGAARTTVAMLDGRRPDGTVRRLHRGNASWKRRREQRLRRRRHCCCRVLLWSTSEIIRANRQLLSHRQTAHRRSCMCRNITRSQAVARIANRIAPSPLGSRDVIGHVTIWYPIGHFLLVILWNQASICNGFRDIQRRM